MRIWVAGALLTTALLPSVATAQAAPSSDDFMRALERSLLKLRPAGFSERQVLFANVRQGRGGGGSHAFQADVVIRDYGAGYPPNGYFGETCIGRMPAARFEMVRDPFGEWVAQGALTPNDRQCTRNPARDVSAVPLASLTGTAAPVASPGARAAAPGSAPARASTPPADTPTPLRLGEYGCFGRGGIVMAGMGFRLDGNGRYTDIDGGRGGRYRHDAAAGTLSFSGGHLDGQTAQRSGGPSSFRFSTMVSCEPWRR